MSAIIKAYADGVLVEQWNDALRVYTNFREDPASSRPYTPEENAAADQRAVQEARDENREALTDTADLLTRLQRLKAYETDPDILAALARANSTAPTTQELNRLLKVMLRREQRISAALALLIRLLDPALQGDITDTAEV